MLAVAAYRIFENVASCVNLGESVQLHDHTHVVYFHHGETNLGGDIRILPALPGGRTKMMNIRKLITELLQSQDIAYDLSSLCAFNFKSNLPH